MFWFINMHFRCCLFFLLLFLTESKKANPFGYLLSIISGEKNQLFAEKNHLHTLHCNLEARLH